MAATSIENVRRAPGARARLIALILFVGFWLFVRWLVAATWEDGEPFPVVVVEWLVLPFLAGIFAGWWRGPHTGAAALLPGGLAAVVVALVDICFLAEIWRLFANPPLDLLAIDWDLPLFLTIVAFVLGSFGAMLSSIVALRVTSKSAPQHP